MTFRAALNAINPKVSYSWSVNAGTIVKGQDTAEITVATTSELAGSSIKASVEVIGLPPNCERAASETAGIVERLRCGLPADEWGEMKPNDERARLDMFFAEIVNNPNNVGLIRLRTKRGERMDPANKRIQFVLRRIKFRKFDKSRIWFALEVAEEKLTTLYRIPPGAAMH